MELYFIQLKTFFFFFKLDYTIKDYLFPAYEYFLFNYFSHSRSNGGRKFSIVIEAINNSAKLLSDICSFCAELLRESRKKMYTFLFG